MRGPAAEEMGEAHPDKSLKKKLFLQRQCVMLSLAGCSLAEYHKKIYITGGELFGERLCYWCT